MCCHIDAIANPSFFQKPYFPKEVFASSCPQEFTPWYTEPVHSRYKLLYSVQNRPTKGVTTKFDEMKDECIARAEVDILQYIENKTVGDLKDHLRALPDDIDEAPPARPKPKKAVQKDDPSKIKKSKKKDK